MKPTDYQRWWMERLDGGDRLFLCLDLHYYFKDGTKVDRRSLWAASHRAWIKERENSADIEIILTPAGREALKG